MQYKKCAEPSQQFLDIKNNNLPNKGCFGLLSVLLLKQKSGIKFVILENNLEGQTSGIMTTLQQKNSMFKLIKGSTVIAEHAQQWQDFPTL